MKRDETVANSPLNAQPNKNFPMKFITAIATLSSVSLGSSFHVPIRGALAFYESDCPEVQQKSTERIQIEEDVAIRPANAEKIKSFNWIYPTPSYIVEFYESFHHAKPYATIQGTSTGFAGHVCKGFKAQHDLKVITSFPKDSPGLFLGPDSYFVVVRKDVLPE